MVNTNVGLCIPIYSIGMPAYIYRAEEVEFNPPPLLKDLSNGFIVVYDISFVIIHKLLL